jgi:nucleotide-binding universal stress UspA family protein
MKTEMIGPVTWFVNSHGMLEKALGRLDRMPAEPRTVPNFRPGSQELNGHRFDGGESAESVTGFDEEAGANRASVIVVPFESSECSLKAAKVGVSIARHTGGQLVLCYALFPKVIPFGPATPSWVQEALGQEAIEKMKPVLELARELKVTATCEIGEGTPTAVILKVARRWGADLIVLTSEKPRIWSRLLFGPHTTEQVIEQAECHVMVLRNGRTT